MRVAPRLRLSSRRAIGLMLCLAFAFAAGGSARVAAATAPGPAVFKVLGTPCTVNDRQLERGIEFVPGGHDEKVALVPICLRGSIRIRFHGARGAGCARHGLCAYHGLETWRPRIGVLTLERYRLGGRWHRMTHFSWLGGPGVTTVVRRRGPRRTTLGTCRSAAPSRQLRTSAVTRHGTVRLPLLYGRYGPWSSPCATPAPSVIAPVTLRLPSPARLQAEPFDARLQLQRRFSAGGFAGVVSADLRGATGVARAGPVPRQRAGPRRRLVRVEFRVRSLTGSVRASWSAVAAGCRALDACGLFGTTRIRSGRPGRLLALDATGPPRRPERDYLAALGLGDRGDPRGILVSGQTSGNEDAAVSSSTQQGARRCRAGSGPAFNAVLIDQRFARTPALHPVPVGLTASYLVAPPMPDALRTSCPGPELGGQIVATIAIPPGGLAGAAPVISLAKSSSFTRQGYTVALRSDLRLSLRRLSITRSVCREFVCP